ncbi:hypothetical protein LWI28_026295 [Acer negundo]|uniref:Uncharacterized protein n=1 Tax=Acer negundo TaxID=4023 RepID=A0AAD5IG98_ACENE|nr:hypothetical protein LWI28_026295 [Acer negundo]
MNGIHVYSSPISCKIAEFGWKDRKHRRDRGLSEQVGNNVGYDFGRSSYKVGVPNNSRIDLGRRFASYADVVKEGGRAAIEVNGFVKKIDAVVNGSVKKVDSVNTGLGSGIKWYPSNDVLSWAKYCVVGILFSIKSLSSVCSRLIKKGIPYEVYCLGGLKTLWSFRGLIWEQLGLRQNCYPAASELVNSLAKSLNGELVVFQKDVRSRRLDSARCTTVEEEDTDRRSAEPIELQECENVGFKSQNVKVADRSVVVEDRELLGFIDDGVSFSKGKSAAVINKKASLSSKTVGQSKLSIRRINSRCQLSELSTEDSLDGVSTDGESLGLHENRAGPSNGGKSPSGPTNGCLNLEVGNVDRTNYALGFRTSDKESIGLVDPIARSLADKSPLGQSSHICHELFVDLGSGIKVVNNSQNNLVLSNSSNDEEKISVGDQLRKSNYRGDRGRGRGRRKAALTASHHDMRTRKSSKKSVRTETGGSEWELEAEFTKVIKESISKGVIMDEGNRFYDKEEGWCMDEEVDKVMETGAILGLKFFGNEETLRNEISIREKEDKEWIKEL